MIHELLIPDVLNGGELRRITWDDETGAIRGDHFQVPFLRQRLDKVPPVVFIDECGMLTLDEPGRNASDFVALLQLFCGSGIREPTDHLPESLAAVTPTPWEPFPLRRGAVA